MKPVQHRQGRGCEARRGFRECAPADGREGVRRLGKVAAEHLANGGILDQLYVNR
jgi:hypothetical protein